MLPEPAFVFFATAKRGRYVHLKILRKETVVCLWPIHPNAYSGLSVLHGQVSLLLPIYAALDSSLVKIVPETSLTVTESRFGCYEGAAIGVACIVLIGSNGAEADRPLRHEAAYCRLTSRCKVATEQDAVREDT